MLIRTLIIAAGRLVVAVLTALVALTAAARHWCGLRALTVDFGVVAVVVAVITRAFCLFLTLALADWRIFSFCLQLNKSYEAQ